MTNKVTIIDSRNINLNQHLTKERATPLITTVLSDSNTIPGDIALALSVYAQPPVEINIIVESNDWINQTKAAELVKATRTQCEQYLERKNIEFKPCKQYLYTNNTFVELT